MPQSPQLLFRPLISLSPSPFLLHIHPVDHSNRTVLHYACDHVNPRCLQLLLKRVPLSMLEDVDDQGMTPLLWAAHHGHVAHSRLLLLRAGDAYHDAL